MGQNVSTMLSQWNPFASRNPPTSNEDRRQRRGRNTRTTEPRENGSPLSERFSNTHFLMGGKRFELPKPDTFLFGNNADLDLMNAPVKFPYRGVADAVSVLNALINIRRDSIRLIKDVSETPGEKSSTYRVEFTYDCDVKCYVQIHYCAREIVEGESVRFDVRYPELKPSKKFFCNAGADQVFNEILFKPHQFDPQKMYYNGGFWFPVVIEMRTQDPTSAFREQSQLTLCVVERSSQNHSSPLVLKPVKQKLIIDGVVYLLQEIFGIENREANNERDFECSICKDNESNTLLLPCRHLCICKSCDDSFLHNVKECPFCRSPVKALLTLDAVRMADGDSNSSRVGQLAVEHVKLIEALNGPIVRSECNTLSRASSMSGSVRESVPRDVCNRKDLVNNVFRQDRSSSEAHSDSLELQDIRIHQAGIETA